MADQKISALTELAAEPATDDNFVVVDTSAVETKRITWATIKAIFALAAKGVTNGDTHDHAGGDGAQISHTGLSNIGTNAHSVIDTFIASKAGVSGLASLDASSKVVQDPANATATPTASKIPIATAGGKLDGWITAAVADGATAGLPAFTAADFNAAAGVISIDYTNAQKASTTQAGLLTELATAAEINTGTDAARAMAPDQFVASNRNVRWFLIRVGDSATNLATGTTKGGDVELPFTGTITEIGAYVDTAGTTGTMTVDVNLNGTTLMTTNKITIDTAEKSSRTAATAAALTTTAVTAGDLITIDIDAIHTTPSKGLTVRIGIRQS